MTGALISVEIPSWLKQHFVNVTVDQAVSHAYNGIYDFEDLCPELFVGEYDLMATYVTIVLGELGEYVTRYINEKERIEDCDFFVTYQGGSNFIRSDDPSSAELNHAYHRIWDAETSWLNQNQWMSGEVPLTPIPVGAVKLRLIK